MESTQLLVYLNLKYSQMENWLLISIYHIKWYLKSEKNCQLQINIDIFDWDYNSYFFYTEKLRKNIGSYWDQFVFGQNYIYDTSTWHFTEILQIPQIRRYGHISVITEICPELKFLLLKFVTLYESWRYNFGRIL